MGRGLRAVGILPELAKGFSTCWTAWIGIAIYWALDIAAFYGAVRFIGLRPILGEVILAYATGYALTRRSMPLGGAGVIEALMTFALHWMGEPVSAALAVVVVYRVFNLVLPAWPALSVRRHIQPFVLAAQPAGPRRPTLADRPPRRWGGCEAQGRGLESHPCPRRGTRFSSRRPSASRC